MKNIFAILCFLLLVGNHNSLAQDAQFTQFFNTPVYINPALTGTTEQWRANLLHRSQWLAIDAQFISTNLSGEFNAVALRTGFGFLFTHDLAGKDRFLNTSVSGLFSHLVPLGKWNIKLGGQLTLSYQSRDFSNLVFVSQILQNEPPVWEGVNAANRWLVDASGGVVAYNKTFWAGFAIHHINQPNISDFHTGAVRMPMRMSLHGGANFSFKSGYDKIKIMPAALFKLQGASKQFDINTRVAFDKLPLILGVYYRDFLLRDTYRDALAFSVGWKFGDLTATYSYDLTISGLTPASGGTHEISIVFETATKAHRQFYGVECPIFH
jgi:type IX secretion system PorP/SprF family membrane protein